MNRMIPLKEHFAGCKPFYKLSFMRDSMIIVRNPRLRWKFRFERIQEGVLIHPGIRRPKCQIDASTYEFSAAAHTEH